MPTCYNDSGQAAQQNNTQIGQHASENIYICIYMYYIQKKKIYAGSKTLPASIQEDYILYTDSGQTAQQNNTQRSGK
jgi:hypothetical protein